VTAISRRKVQLIDPDKAADTSSVVRARVKELQRAVRELNWQQAEALATIQQKRLWAVWGFRSWVSYLKSEAQTSLRTAQYLVGTWTHFSTQPAEIRDWAYSIGWTRAKELVGLVNAQNLRWWQHLVEVSTARELVEIAKVQRRQKER